MTNAIVWKMLEHSGHEYAHVFLSGDQWSLAGTAVFSYERSPCRLNYEVLCDARWRTRSVNVHGWVGSERVDLALSVDGAQQWCVNGVAVPLLSGCIDIDLGFSPSTNLLPIRRLGLDIGQEARVEAAWLRFPSLELAVLSQSYRREAVSTYRYESGGGEFTSRLEVNDVGFVTSYPGLWHAESAA